MRVWLVVFGVGCTGAEETKDDPTGPDPSTDTTPTDTGPIDVPTDTATTPTTSPPPCEVGVLGIFPADGATDVFYRTEARFNLDTPVPDATVAVVSDAGAPIAGTSTVEDTVVRWSGDAALSPNATYTATVDYGCGTTSASWTTGTVGGAVEADLIGRTYAVDFQSGSWLEPRGLGDLFAKELGDTQVFLSPLAIDDDTIDMIGATGAGDVQFPCLPTIAFPTRRLRRSLLLAGGRRPRVRL